MIDHDPRVPWVRQVHRLVEGLYGRVFWLIASLGLPPAFIVRLQVKGRRSGKLHSTVLVSADHNGDRYLVSVLGEGSDWVRNARRAGGVAMIRHGRTRQVRLEEVPVDRRAPILKAYLKRALGARPLFEVAHKAPVEEFEHIASRYPVFRIGPAMSAAAAPNQGMQSDARKDARR